MPKRVKSPVAEHLGRELRKLRKEQRLSIVAFAEEVGLSSPTVHAMETGTGGPTKLDIWIKVFDHFGALDHVFILPAPGRSCSR